MAIEVNQKELFFKTWLLLYILLISIFTIACHVCMFVLLSYVLLWIILQCNYMLYDHWLFTSFLNCCCFLRLQESKMQFMKKYNSWYIVHNNLYFSKNWNYIFKTKWNYSLKKCRHAQNPPWELSLRSHVTNRDWQTGSSELFRAAPFFSEWWTRHYSIRVSVTILERVG